VGCGTVEWNALSGKVEQKREMLKVGRSGRRPINKQHIMQVVLTCCSTSRKVILLESGNISAVESQKKKSPEGD
jgi:hypothetical protein